ncbi:DUF3139 domain-containing protein [Paenibacillus sp. HJL G12]|uniref:DUF3139 domain-containing protein n=1 Tax=Paenibacillus dendrobii TaxID=2691084 RepID=A0A7X3IIF5_9BACL|nr:DUF3139 domain-containing protein [Paenibacillus dendrobii]MWV44305.1 DUF3139 domain-containing protein [Paenibacillus dendrobii]
MKKIWMPVALLILLMLGFGAGTLYSDYVKVNAAVKESLERRTMEYLKKQGYPPEQYTMKTLKGVKFDGMKDYHVDVQFTDEPGHHYDYGEDNDGNMIQYGYNGTKHIEQ